jgi:hypothetical protein
VHVEPLDRFLVFFYCCSCVVCFALRFYFFSPPFPLLPSPRSLVSRDWAKHSPPGWRGSRPPINGMPRGTKRKFTSNQEPSGHMAPQASNQRAALLRPIPTPETQELYNKMRREEEKLTEESLEQVQEGPPSHLQLPLSSQVTVSSPSLSHASTTHSISQAMNDMGVAGDPPGPRGQRPGRHGPLSEKKKARTHLMRKLGACNECRERRVKARAPGIHCAVSTLSC